VNPHLPLVESVSSLSRRRFSRWDDELLGRQWYWSFQLDTSLIGNVFDLGADGVDVLGVCAGQADSSFGNHTRIPSSSTFAAKSQGGSGAVKNLGVNSRGNGGPEFGCSQNSDYRSRKCKVLAFLKMQKVACDQT